MTPCNNQNTTLHRKLLIILAGFALLAALFMAATPYAIRNAIAVSYHKQRMRATEASTDREAYGHHKRALLRLGYLEQRDFPLLKRIINTETRRELMQRVDATLWAEKKLWSITTTGEAATALQI